MGDFVIDTPYHKRWWLPDNKHQYNSVIYGSTLRFSVLEALSGSTVLSGSIDLTKDNWKELAELSQELAEKRFRRQPERKRK